MTDVVVDLLIEAADKLEEAGRDHRFEKNETDLPSHKLYEIEWKFLRPLEKFISEVES